MNYAYSDDYAVVELTGMRFYYGYESTDENGDWCFEVTMTYANVNRQLMKIPYSELKLKMMDGMFDVVDCLLCGIMMWLTAFERNDMSLYTEVEF